MSRSLTNLAPDLYTAVDIISRELVGFVPAVSSDMTHARAAIGETVYSPVTASATATDIAAAVTPPDDGDNPLTAAPLTITRARRVPVRINGEQQRILNDSVGWATVRAMEFAQAMRTLVNEIEADLAALYLKASRAYGTAGTTPFDGTNKLAAAAHMQKILDDNGAPQTDRQLVINTAAAVNLAQLTQLTNVSDAGDADLLRRGVISDLFGFQVRKSAKAGAHTAGTGAGYKVDLTAGYAAGTSTVHIDTGTGTVVVGDVVSIADDPSASQYVVTGGFAGDGDGDITIAAPGLMGAVVNDKNVTLAAAYTANMAFSRSALYLATRAPAVPTEGDSATDAMVVTDPVTGISFEIREYRQYRQVQYEVGIAWGVACVKPEHCAILLG